MKSTGAFYWKWKNVFPGEEGMKARLSLIQEWPASSRTHGPFSPLSVVPPSNGVSAMHSELVKKQVFHDFDQLYPTLFNNKTNGVTLGAG